MSVVVVKCNCKHDFQDKEYGKGNRVCNILPSKTTGDNRCRCTVCGTIHNYSKSKENKDENK